MLVLPSKQLHAADIFCHVYAFCLHGRARVPMQSTLRQHRETALFRRKADMTEETALLHEVLVR